MLIDYVSDVSIMDETSATINPEIQTEPDDTPMDTTVNETEYFLDYEDTTGATDWHVSQGRTSLLLTGEAGTHPFYRIPCSFSI